MILQSLRQLAIEERLTEANAFENKPVKWVIVLDQDGHFLGLTDTLEDDQVKEGKKKRKPRPKMMSIPRRIRKTSNACADFLVANSEYTLGVEPDGKRSPEDLQTRRGLYLKKIRDAADATTLLDLQAVSSFVSDGGDTGKCVARLMENGYASNDLFTFRVHGELLHEHPVVQTYCATLWEAAEMALNAAPRQCLVCGETRPPVETHDAIQVPGGVTSGVGMVAFNSNAFEKYGLERNDNAPLCRDCMTAYVEAIRRCLSDRYPDPRTGDALPRQSVKLTGDTTALYWADSPSPLVAKLFHLQSDPGEITHLLESPWTGVDVGSVNADRFFCLILSGAQGRAILRSVHTGTLAGLERNLRHYFQCLAVPGQPLEKPLPLFLLLKSLAPAEKIDKLPPGLAGDVFLAAVLGRPLPRRILAAAVSRNIAEQRVTPARAALLHLYLEINPSLESPPMSLDATSPDPAYRLGRLLAVLEKIQYKAQGKLNKNIVDRFYSAASTRPGTVFPKLIQLTQFHLPKLSSNPTESERLKSYWNNQIAEVLSGLSEFRSILNLEEQGRFALGYYHQRNFKPTSHVAISPTTNEDIMDDQGDAR